MTWATPAEIASVCEAKVDLSQIEAHWDALVHLSASVMSGHASAVAALARFGSAARGEPIYKAGVQLGRLLRTAFVADYIVNEALRRELRRALNRGEAVNALKRAIYTGRISPAQAKRVDEMQAVADALSLLANIVMAWNTTQMQAVLDRWASRRQVIAPELIGRIAPTRLEGINLRGVFRFPIERYLDQLLPSQSAAKTSVKNRPRKSEHAAKWIGCSHGRGQSLDDRSRRHEQKTPHHSAAFKAKAAIEALADGRTIAEVALKHDVHLNQVTEWRRQLIEYAAGVAGGATASETPPVDLKVLNAKIGQLTLENEFFGSRAQQGRFAGREAMIERGHELPIKRQAELLGLSRGTVYYHPEPISESELALMRRIDELHLEHPFAGSRMLRDLLRLRGIDVGRRHVGTLMRRMGIEALYRKPNSKKHPSHARRPLIKAEEAIRRTARSRKYQTHRQALSRGGAGQGVGGGNVVTGCAGAQAAQ